MRKKAANVLFLAFYPYEAYSVIVEIEHSLNQKTLCLHFGGNCVLTGPKQLKKFKSYVISAEESGEEEHGSRP